MIRRMLMLALLGASAVAAQASERWDRLVAAEAGLSGEMSRLDTVLAWHDLAGRIAVAQGQIGANEADARLSAMGARLFAREIGESDFAEARAQLNAAVAGYLEATARAAAASTRWPEGAAMQARAQRILDDVRASYPGWIQQRLDPTALVMQIARVAGWARGESTVANPFAGHAQRLQAAYPDPRARQRIAAAEKLTAPDGKPVVATPVQPPPREPVDVRRPIPGELGATRPISPPPTRRDPFVGCYKDTSAFDLDGHLERSPSNTPQACIADCARRGYRYAGVQYGESCLCGDRYGRYGPADNCNYRCTGDAAQICGGYSANSIYMTGASGAPMHAELPSLPSAAGTWTAWFDRDDPDGSADWEALAELRGGVPCARPAAVECRVRSDGRHWQQAGQRYKCDLSEPNPGGICINSDNASGCLDYEVRFLCAN